MASKCTTNRNSIVLTERDRTLLVELARMRMLTRAQIQTLGMFGSVTRANTRLKRLCDRGFVIRVDPPLGTHPGLGIYRPGSNATKILAHAFGIGKLEVARLLERPSPLLTTHTLATADVRVSLSRSVDRCAWQGESECFHLFSVRESAAHAWREEALRPDGYVEVQRHGHEFCAFVEVDLGHVSLPRFAEKLLRYETYVACGLFAKRYGKSAATVLVASTGAKRIEHLQALAATRSLTLRFCSFVELRSKGWETTNWFDSHGTIVSLAPGFEVHA